jgi:hypothetical protein
MLFREIIAVYCDNHTEHTKILWAECRVLVCQSRCTYSCHYAVKVTKRKQVKKTVIFRGPENVNMQEIKIGDPVLRRKLLEGISVLEINPRGMPDKEDG